MASPPTAPPQPAGDVLNAEFFRDRLPLAAARLVGGASLGLPFLAPIYLAGRVAPTWLRPPGWCACALEGGALNATQEASSGGDDGECGCVVLPPLGLLLLLVSCYKARAPSFACPPEGAGAYNARGRAVGVGVGRASAVDT